MWDSIWDNIFSEIEWGSYPPEELVRFVARNFYKLPDRKAVKFLEIGCGPGGNLMFLSREGFNAVGIDGSQVAIDRASGRLKRSKLLAQLDRGDAMKLPYPADSFDCVFEIECFYANSLRDTRQMIAEAHRVLKPGGLLFSKTFAVNMTGEGSGRRVEGEPKTYVALSVGPLKDKGLVRFTEEAEIPSLYGVFEQLEIEWVARSDNKQSWVIREWLITGRKKR